MSNSNRDTHIARSSESRLERYSSATIQSSWREPQELHKKVAKEKVSVDCGWGKLIFAHTFSDTREVIDILKKEKPHHRDIAFYVRDPHVLVSHAPEEVFIDPSNTYRLWFNNYRPSKELTRSFFVRRIKNHSDIDEICAVCLSRKMVPPSKEFLWKSRNSRKVFYLVVADVETGDILGAVLAVDHEVAFKDPEKGCSLWSLAVRPSVSTPGVGKALTRYVIEYFQARGRQYLDLSVMHDNNEAIALYEKLGFERVPVYAVKRKNPINESLFTAPLVGENLNPYARIIIDEARRRGIRTDIIDEKKAIFSLTLGSRTIRCRESLSELTSAVAMSICDDKSLTRKLLLKEGINFPAQRPAGGEEENKAFLELHERLVVKPARGEQGQGISVDISDEDSLVKAVRYAQKVCDSVLLEKYVVGYDVRFIVINYEMVAAAVRKPAQITGDGMLSIKELIKKQSRRRKAATAGESTIPLDAETERAISNEGYNFDDILPDGKVLVVRKTANLHTGGTIHDITDLIHPEVKKQAEKAAQLIGIPCTGLDFIMPELDGTEYYAIEANERPGLENHQPQPTAERFIDMLFSETKV